MFRITRKQFAAFAFLGLGTVAALSTLSGSTAADPGDARLLLDVAMDGTSFFFEGDTTRTGVPARGTPFVIEGYIYPRGTFARYGELSGVLPDGSPEFPNLVLGKWVCKGWHLLDGDAVTGTVVSTAQSFDFDLDRPGADMITSEGIELADFDVPFQRVVTGGTGRFLGASGQHTQVYVGNGLNESGGFNTSFGFDMTTWR